jgi:putative peptidoglycan lipid II flippase
MISVMTPLARPIVRVLFERRAFGAPASGLVSSLVICYVLGSTFYLARDVLVRVFYALGDGQTPFYISLAAIVANAALDWLLVRFGGFGAPGLVLATMVVNIASAGALLTQLSGRLGGMTTDNQE